ncbi:rhodanese-like domain-containing protein [Pseudomonas chlororaphis]|uniref:rhodanese-like domain-containing protein n=1 Tax=Pseudomonas chlororaphis TaxID=587753 RepID=UPI001B327B1C|nr:rhodanese-like domain-containing protein [Pseudomonas chlororaphis]MBP5059383.1 rhodanese-like domain-containing protein [Pseudomonas chlororaphis]
MHNAPGLVAILAYNGLCTFEFGIAVEIFGLLDVRGPLAFERGHVPGAINLPGRLIDAERLAGYSRDTLFVVYCAGPHCNGANKAAVRLAALGYPVKEMIGGVTGWLDEGFKLSVELERPASVVVECAC